MRTLGKGARAQKRRNRERAGSYQDAVLSLWQEQDRKMREDMDLADRWMARKGGDTLPDGFEMDAIIKGGRVGRMNKDVVQAMADEQRVWEAQNG